MVQGVFSCDDFVNKGALSLSGVVTNELPCEGVIVVSAGTLFTDSRPPYRLTELGTLEAVGDGEDIHVHSGEGQFRLAKSGGFIHLADVLENAAASTSKFLEL
jgi:hypothetical protein